MNGKKINEATSDSGGARGSYVSPLVPGFKDFDGNLLSPFTEPVSKYNNALLAYDSYDGKMDTPKNLRKKMENKSRKITNYIKNNPHVVADDDDGGLINHTPGKGHSFVPINEWVEITESNTTVTAGLYNGPIEVGMKKWRESELGPFKEFVNSPVNKKKVKGKLKNNISKKVGVWEKGKDGTYNIDTHDTHTINEDLAVWFGTKKKPKGSKQPKGPWVNICKKVDGKHPPCGRPEATDKAYPKCRAAGVAGKMSDSEKRNACQQKRRAEKTHPKSGTGNEPKMVSHKKRTNESLIRKYILLEKRIGQLVSNMEVVFAFDLITTKHSDDRGMGRSIENYDDRPVSNREILEVFNLFKEDIAEKIIEGEIYDQKDFIIVSNKWGLSIPLVAVREDYGTYWKFIVKTVFRSTSELRLRTGKDQLILEK